VHLEYKKIIFRFNLTDVLESGTLPYWIKFLEENYLWAYKFHIWDEQIKSYNFSQYSVLDGVDMNFFNTKPRTSATFDMIYLPCKEKYYNLDNGRYATYWSTPHYFVDNLYIYKNFLNTKIQGEK